MGITLFRRKSQVEKWCNQSGIHFRCGDGLYYEVLQQGEPAGAHTLITVKHQEKLVWSKFICQLPVRFPLARTPDGLFARVMMRSTSLGYARWSMDIQESCDALLYLCALHPTQWLNPAVFGAICREMGDEARSFHRELRDKFNYGGRSDGGYTDAEVRQASPGVPMLHPDNLPRRYS